MFLYKSERRKGKEGGRALERGGRMDEDEYHRPNRKSEKRGKSIVIEELEEFGEEGRQTNRQKGGNPTAGKRQRGGKHFGILSWFWFNP